MLHIDMTRNRRESKKKFKDFDMAVYAKKMFGMYGGEEEVVKLECDNCLAE